MLYAFTYYIAPILFCLAAYVFIPKITDGIAHDKSYYILFQLSITIPVSFLLFQLTEHKWHYRLLMGPAVALVSAILGCAVLVCMALTIKLNLPDIYTLPITLLLY